MDLSLAVKQWQALLGEPSVLFGEAATAAMAATQVARTEAFRPPYE